MRQKIGQGCYGRIYRILDDDKPYIVKRNILDSNQEYFSSIKEMDIMKKLNHPNIVKLIDFKIGTPLKRLSPAGYGNKNDKLYFIMESGECDMYYLIDNKLIPEHAYIYLFAQMLLGLEYLHAHEIIHRDIKPGNVIYFENSTYEEFTDFNVKFCDFGMSKWHTNKEPGTPGVTTYVYRAPEIVLGYEYGYSSDIWALGMLFYEMVTGRPLLDCEKDNVKDIIFSQMMAIPELPEKHELGYLADDVYINAAIELRKDNKFFDDYPIVKPMLIFNPDNRPSATQLLNDKYFDSIRWYIDMIRRDYPPNSETIIEKRILNPMRKQMEALVDIVLSQDPMPSWVTFRSLAMAIDLYDSCIESISSETDLLLFAFSCLHLAVKYHTTMKIPPQLKNILPGSLCKKTKICDKLQENIIHYHLDNYGILFRKNIYELLPGCYGDDFMKSYFMDYMKLTGEIVLQDYVNEYIKEKKLEY